MDSFRHTLDAAEAARRELLIDDTAFQTLVTAQQNEPIDRPGAVSANERRDGLWKEVLREMAVSNDRLLCFLRQVAGLVGEEVSNLIVRDEQAEQAQKAKVRTVHSRPRRARRVQLSSGATSSSIDGSCFHAKPVNAVAIRG